MMRLSLVIMKVCQLVTQSMPSRLTSSSADRSLVSSARPPELRNLWNSSTIQQMAYQSSIWIAFARDPCGGSVTGC